MKKVVLGLALAGASFAASALPPPGMGTPLNVNVTNPVLPVEVSNADPVPVRIADTAAFQPFRFSKSLVFGGNDVEQEVVVVPSGKRLVIEHVSWKCFCVSPGQVFSMNLLVDSPSPLLYHALLMPISPPHPTVDTNLVAQEGAEVTQLYFEPGERVYWRMQSTNGFFSCALAAHGHYDSL